MSAHRRLCSFLPVLWATILLALPAAAAPAPEAKPAPAPGGATGGVAASEIDEAGNGDEVDDPHRASGHEADGAHGGHSSRLSDEAIELQLDGFPERPKPLVELGEPFLGTGTLSPGFELPTGAVWQPSLLVFGSLRAGLQTFEEEGDRVSELAARLDLFANLQLTGSERLVVGFRPLDEDGRFTSYVLGSDRPGLDTGFQDSLNGEVTSLFFEGDFGEIFPNLSRDDFAPTDVGFSVGRQPLQFQEGLLIDDVIDGLGLTRNSLQPAGTSNFRATFFWGWNEVGRAGGGGNVEDGQAQLVGLLTSTDLPRSTVDADLVYVASDGATGDLVSAGVSAVQRLGRINSSFRLLASSAVGDETPFSTDGVLAFSEISWSPHGRHDLIYVNGFVAVDEFSSAARGPASGGPLGRAGINFAAVGLGSYAAALSSRARDVAGGAFGYQRFFADTRRQVLAELGFRVGTAADVADSVAATVRYQAAYGRRWVLVVDAFGGYRQAVLPGDSDRSLSGGRVELLTKF